MYKTRVAVLRGGPSAEYEISLQTGSAVLRNLPEEYHGIDIFIDKNGLWHRSGMETSPYQALKNVDVVFNALHGGYGEDGKLQRTLESFKVPYTGSRTLPSAISIDKILAKDVFRHEGIRTPRSAELRVSEDADEKLLAILSGFPLPAIIKPGTSGSSLGVTFARSLEEVERGVRRAFLYSPKVLVEEYIDGTEGTVGIIDGYRGEETYALSPVEIVPTEREFFDYDGKYKGRAMQFAPSRFEDKEIARMQVAARAIHRALGLRHYSRTDFILSSHGILYALEINALPGLYPDSSFERSLRAGNVGYGEFLRHLLSLAIEKN